MHKIGTEFKVRLTPSQETCVREIAFDTGESLAGVIRLLVRAGLATYTPNAELDSARADDTA